MYSQSFLSFFFASIFISFALSFLSFYLSLYPYLLLRSVSRENIFIFVSNVTACKRIHILCPYAQLLALFIVYVYIIVYYSWALVELILFVSITLLVWMCEKVLYSLCVPWFVGFVILCTWNFDPFFYCCCCCCHSFSLLPSVYIMYICLCIVYLYVKGVLLKCYIFGFLLFFLFLFAFCFVGKKEIERECEKRVQNCKKAQKTQNRI